MPRLFRTRDVFLLIAGAMVVVLFILAYALFPVAPPIRYSASLEAAAPMPPVEPPVAHVSTPIPVKGLYMSQCLAANEDLRSQLVKLVNETEINSIVIDIKDYSGGVSFESKNPVLAGVLSKHCHAADMKEFIATLHKQGIYVIGRITVFQDPTMTALHPELAIKYQSNKEKLWTDRKGISYIDPGAKEMWDYIVVLAREAHQIGFDEINFDYIRFPSDGNMQDIYFPFSESIIDADPHGGKAEVLTEFFSYLDRELRGEGITISADVFGMTTTNTDDLNIGQVLENILPHFDYVAPMVYPSHYPPGFLGYENPASKPYEVVKFSMESAVARASTTPWKLRPWLQDFNLGAIYTPEMIQAQMRAVHESGLGSWLLWNAANRYTREALSSE